MICGVLIVWLFDFVELLPLNLVSRFRDSESHCIRFVRVAMFIA